MIIVLFFINKNGKIEKTDGTYFILKTEYLDAKWQILEGDNK